MRALDEVQRRIVRLLSETKGEFTPNMLIDIADWMKNDLPVICDELHEVRQEVLHLTEIEQQFEQLKLNHELEQSVCVN